MKLVSKVQAYHNYILRIANAVESTTSEVRDKGYALSFDEYCRAREWTRPKKAQGYEAILQKAASGTLQERLKREAVGDMIVVLRGIAREKRELESTILELECGDFDEEGLWA